MTTTIILITKKKKNSAASWTTKIIASVDFLNGHKTLSLVIANFILY